MKGSFDSEYTLYSTILADIARVPHQPTATS